MTFERITSNATDNIEDDISLVVTDLGSNIAQIEIIRGDSFIGFLRNIYFEDVDDHTIGASFDPVASSAGLMFSDPSNPANPPGIAGFMTKYSFDADSPQPTTKSIGPGETGAFKLDYTGSTYADVEQAFKDGTMRVAVHGQGLDAPGAQESDSFVNRPPGIVTIPEPSTLALLLVGTLLPLRRSRPAR